MGSTMPKHTGASRPERENFLGLVRLFLLPNDGRYEDLWLPGTTFYKQVLHDFFAGLIIATLAIPVAMGFAIASGLQPVQGIVGGAVAGGLGALVGGSKYQIYGSTAAFTPLVMSMIHEFSEGNPDNYFYATGCLTFCSCVAGMIIILMGFLQLGSYVQKVPHSIVVGFTLGIATVIFISELSDIFGLPSSGPHSSAGKLTYAASEYANYNWYCIFISLMTFVLIKGLALISVFIPGPIVSIAIGVFLTEYVWPDKGIIRVVDKYGPIPTDLLQFTPPIVPSGHLGLIAKAVVSIVFVSVIESLLCSRMADKLANNTRLQFHPNKELWGQGWVQIIVPMLNGFPHTGALARTATNVKVGAVSPLAGIFLCIFKLLLAFLTTPILNVIPMACVGGILAYVAVNMVKMDEIHSVVKTGDLGAMLVMTLTALVVLFRDFLAGIAAGLLLHVLLEVFRPAGAPISLGEEIQVNVTQAAVSYDSVVALCDENGQLGHQGRMDSHKNWAINQNSSENSEKKEFYSI